MMDALLMGIDALLAYVNCIEKIYMIMVILKR